MGVAVSGYRTDPQVLDARGRVPRGESNLGLGAGVALDGQAGLVVGLAFRGRVESGEHAAGIPVAGALPPGSPDDLMLAVAWGAGPEGTDETDGEMGGEYSRTWVPAAGCVRTQTYIPGGRL